MRLLLICSLVTTCIFGTASAQEVAHEPVLGTIQIDGDGVYSCQASGSLLCAACVEDQDTTNQSTRPLIVSFGKTGLSGWSYGTMSGSIQLAAEIDGLTIPPALLPCNSRFSSRMGVGAGYHPFSPCGDQGLDYQINSNSGVFTEGGNHEIHIPAEEANLVSFEINFCNVSAHWGAGCGVNGSINDRWLLWAPGQINAATIASGNAAPLPFPNQNLILDFQQSNGGIVTVLRSEQAAPGGLAPAGPDGYWEITTDMADGSYSVVVTLEFDSASLPADINPAALMIARFDRTQNGWESLNSVVDITTGTVTATTSGLSKLVLATESVVTVTRSTFGAVKARF